MIELIATAESVEQVIELLATGVGTLYIEEETFGLHLPVSFTRDEQREIMKRAHEISKQVLIAINGIIHPKKMKLVPECLTFLREINVDRITLDDPGIVFIMQRDGLEIPYVYDGETLVTSSHRIDFWNRRGTIGAALAREVPFGEVVATEENLAVPVEILVYGATYIHQSKRPLIRNYYNYAENNRGVTEDEELFVSEPKKPETYCSIYEDSHDTHISANNDVNLVNRLTNLYDHHYRTWKLDGLYTPGENFIAIVRLFTEAKTAFEAGTWSENQAIHATTEVKKLYPTGRGLDNGFFGLGAGAIK